MMKYLFEAHFNRMDFYGVIVTLASVKTFDNLWILTAIIPISIIGHLGEELLKKSSDRKPK